MTGKRGEDFTGWTEVDPLAGEPDVPAYGRLRQFAWNDTAEKASKSEWVNLNRLDPATYLYKDYGASHFDDFVHDFDLVVEDMSYGTSSKERLNAIAYSNAIGSWEGVKTGGNVAIAVRVRASVSEDYYYLRLVEWDGSNEYITAAPGTAERLPLSSTIVYCRLTKNGTSLRLDLYENSARNVTIDNPYAEPIYYELTLQADHDFQYILAPQGMGLVDGARRSSSGDVHRLVLDAPTETGSGNLFCEFDVRQAGTGDLFAHFRLRQDVEDLKAEFVLRQENYDLFAKTIIKNKGSEDLYAKFEIQDSEDLKATFLLRQLTKDLYCKFFVSDYVENILIESEFLVYPEAAIEQPIEIEGHYEILGTVETYADLKAVFVVGGYGDLFSKATIRHTGTADLKAVFDVSNHENLFAKFEVDQTSTGVTLVIGTEKFTWDIPDEEVVLEITADYDVDEDAEKAHETIEILSHYEILGTVETYADLKAVFVVGGYGDVFSKTVIRHSSSADLKAVFDVSTHRDLFAKFEVDQTSTGVTLVIGTEKFTWGTPDEELILEITADYDVDEDAEKAHETIEILSHYEILGTVETYADLKAVFVVGGYGDLFSEVTVRHTGTADLKATFDVSTSRDLFAKFVVDQTSAGVTLPIGTEVYTWNEGDESLPLEITSGYILSGTLLSQVDLKAVFRLRQDVEDLYAKLYVQTPYEDLFAKFELRQLTLDLPAELVVRHTETSDLYAKFELQLFQDLFAKFEVASRDLSLDLFSEFVIRHTTIADLYAELVVQHTGTEELFSEFVVRQAGSEDLYAELAVQQSGSADLFSELEVRHSDTKDLYAEFVVRQTGARDLHAELVIRHAAAENLKAELVVQQTGISDLYAKFVVQQTGTSNLPAELIVRHSGAQDLYAELEVRHTSTADLFSELEVRQAAYQELFSVFIVRKAAATDLYAEFVVAHSGSVDLYAETIIRQTGAEDLYAELTVRTSDYRDLFAEFTVQHTGTPLDLFAELVVRHAAAEDLYAEFTVRQVASADLKAVFRMGQDVEDLFAKLYVQVPYENLFAKFILRHRGTRELYSVLYIRHPTWQWTTKRYLEGVISDIPVTDAILEYIIEGVMVDIRGYLIGNDLNYNWANITKVPTLIKRATTYGVVATLYARGYFDNQILVTIPPRTLTLLPEDREGGMEYWEAKMEYMLGLYSSSTPSAIIYVDTWAEEPVFSMDE